MAKLWRSCGEFVANLERNRAIRHPFFAAKYQPTYIIRTLYNLAVWGTIAISIAIAIPIEIAIAIAKSIPIAISITRS